MREFTPNHLPIKKELETKKVLKKTISANRALAFSSGYLAGKLKD